LKEQRDVAKLMENDVVVKYVTELKRCLQDVTASSVDERNEQLSSATRQAVNSSIPQRKHIKKWIMQSTLEKKSAEETTETGEQLISEPCQMCRIDHLRTQVPATV